MQNEEFKEVMQCNKAVLERMRQRAHKLHESVNQTYDRTRPYGYHLDMVAQGVVQYGASVCANPEDALVLMFGAFFHDSIEDARLTYNNVMAIALEFFDNGHALLATEIVYALTNEKGRTRAERADERYYAGIRQTPYAPLVKMADRLANMAYSASHSSSSNSSMRDVYRDELPHFIEAITSPLAQADARYGIPEDMFKAIKSL